VAYEVLRDVALGQRRESCLKDTPRAMKILYEFWRWFLPEYFNAAMYDAFRHLATSDAACECGSNMFGLTRLVALHEDIRSRPLLHNLNWALRVQFEEARGLLMRMPVEPNEGFGLATCKMCQNLLLSCHQQPLETSAGMETTGRVVLGNGKGASDASGQDTTQTAAGHYSEEQ
jgi:hypothetical protein